MKPDELTEFYFTKMNFCGCGQPWKAMRLLFLALKLIDNRRWGYLEAILHSKSNPGLYYTYLYWLESLELTEHGFSISYGWLTAEGIELMESLKLHGFDPDGWKS